MLCNTTVCPLSLRGSACCGAAVHSETHSQAVVLGQQMQLIDT